MSWWETLHLVTWWKRLAISAIKTGQDAPSWIWCTERLSFFGGGHIVLQRFVHVRCHFQPLPTKLVFAYFDRGSSIYYICKANSANPAFDWPHENKGVATSCRRSASFCLRFLSEREIHISVSQFYIVLYTSFHTAKWIKSCTSHLYTRLTRL